MIRKRIKKRRKRKTKTKIEREIKIAIGIETSVTRIVEGIEMRVDLLATKEKRTGRRRKSAAAAELPAQKLRRRVSWQSHLIGSPVLQNRTGPSPSRRHGRPSRTLRRYRERDDLPHPCKSNWPERSLRKLQAMCLTGFRIFSVERTPAMSPVLCCGRVCHIER